MTDNFPKVRNEDSLWLLNVQNGRILRWSPILATNPNYCDCTHDGKPLREEVVTNHEFMRQETINLRKRLESAGASPDSVREFGRMLRERNSEKIRLNYEKAKQISLPGVPIGPLIRMSNRVDEHYRQVKNELGFMVMRAKRDFNKRYDQACFDLWLSGRRVD